MAKYMLNICYGSGKEASHPQDDEFIMNAYRQWSESMGPKIVSAHKLVDGTGRKVVKNSSAVVEGPYVETKESIGGYYIIETSTIEEAVKHARECPTVLYQGGYVDVREVEF
jgi:hypothetical protein